MVCQWQCTAAKSWTVLLRYFRWLRFLVPILLETKLSIAYGKDDNLININARRGWLLETNQQLLFLLWRKSNLLPEMRIKFPLVTYSSYTVLPMSIVHPKEWPSTTSDLKSFILRCVHSKCIHKLMFVRLEHTISTSCSFAAIIMLL